MAVTDLVLEGAKTLLPQSWVSKINYFYLKSPNTTYQKQFKAIIAYEFPSHTLCCTDGSKSGSRTGYAFSSNGRLRNSASIFSAELFAIYFCLSHLSLLLPPLWFRFLSQTLQAMQDPHSTNPSVQRLHVFLHSLSSSSSSFAFLWIPEHNSSPWPWRGRPCCKMVSALHYNPWPLPFQCPWSSNLQSFIDQLIMATSPQTSFS